MPLTARQRSIYNKNEAKRTSSFNKAKRKISEGELIVTNAPSELRTIAYPRGAVALLLLLCARLLSACYGQVADCDETFNYWEPLHYLVYGSGLQTWEYSPQFALRSYLPLWLLALPARALAPWLAPVSVFYALRALLAALTACADLMFYKAVCHEFGVHVGRLWLALALPAAGAWGAAAAMLPSAWSGALVSAALACWWRRRLAPAVLLIAASALLSWPFTAILGLPIAIDALFLRRTIGEFVKWSAVGLVVFLLPAVAVDSWYYGRLTVAPWNIVAYNVFSEFGPSLYGVEPWTYYFVNGFLNFNIVWPLALASPLLLAARGAGRARWRALAGPTLWLAALLPQPHKEERFLQPVYSQLLLAAALALDAAQRLLPRRYPARAALLLAALAALAGVSRIAALYTNYQAPMRILRHVPAAPGGGAVCWGREWHRSPSSWHLPRGLHSRFVRSDFGGQLPAPYAAPPPEGTRLEHAHFNARNVGDPRTYLQPARCRYLVDSHAHAGDAAWRVLAREPLLDAARSSRVLRAFYVPLLSAAHCTFGALYLLENTAPTPPLP